MGRLDREVTIVPQIRKPCHCRAELNARGKMAHNTIPLHYNIIPYFTSRHAWAPNAPWHRIDPLTLWEHVNTPAVSGCVMCDVCRHAKVMCGGEMFFQIPANTDLQGANWKRRRNLVLSLVSSLNLLRYLRILITLSCAHEIRMFRTLSQHAGARRSIYPILFSC